MKTSDDKLCNLFTRRMTQHLSSLWVLIVRMRKHVLDAILRVREKGNETRENMTWVTNLIQQSNFYFHARYLLKFFRKSFVRIFHAYTIKKSTFSPFKSHISKVQIFKMQFYFDPCEVKFKFSFFRRISIWIFPV